MRVVLTGGTGFIGRALAAELAGAGHEVVITGRTPERAAGLPRGVSAVAWDAVAAPALVPILEGAGAIVNLVGESIGARWTRARKQRIRDSRVRSTRAVAEACAAAAARPRVFLQGSAVGLYGPRGDEALGEDSAPGTGFLAEVCREWEAAGESVEALGMRRVVLRSGIVLARRGGALPRMALPFRLFAGGPVGSGEQWVSWIHLDDEVAAIRFLLGEEAASGAFNLASPQPLTNRDFSHELGRALGRPSFARAPGFALRLVLGEMAEMILTGQRAVPQRLLEAGYTFRFPAAAGALADVFARGS